MEMSCQGFDRSKRCSQNGGECLMATIPMAESVKNHQLPLRKLTWNLKILPWKRRNIYKALILGVYVNPGSQPPFKTWRFFGWWQTLPQKMVVRKPTYKKMVAKDFQGGNFEGVNRSRSRGTFIVKYGLSSRVPSPFLHHRQVAHQFPIFSQELSQFLFFCHTCHWKDWKDFHHGSQNQTKKLNPLIFPKSNG